jgi:hypothetical protein
MLKRLKHASALQLPALPLPKQDNGQVLTTFNCQHAGNAADMLQRAMLQHMKLLQIAAVKAAAL